nr:probable ribose-5-phosphate isomerase 1 [Lolium perenne]
MICKQIPLQATEDVAPIPHRAPTPRIGAEVEGGAVVAGGAGVGGESLSRGRRRGRFADLLRTVALRLVVGMATSLKLEAHAARGAFPMLALAVAAEVHLYIDGADKVTPDLNLVKGRACSHLREKVIETERWRPLHLHR